jgi:decaprenylphospho-beta-D-ribofuranose 2-oxidase
MSPVDTKRAPRRPAEQQGVLSGWGRTSPVSVTLVRPGDSSQVAALLAGEAPARGLIPRGAGRSYGDAAQNDAGTVLDMTALTGIEALDSRTGEVRVGAGTTFAELLGALAERGLTLPVVPGTAHLTVGGAIAADVHGKNHRRAGSIARQLRSFALCTPADGEIDVSEADEPELWAATLGGMGLTGAITAATLSTIVLRRPLAIADVDKVDTLEEALELLDADSHSHTIAWLDLMARGRGFARAIVTRSREGEEAAGPDRLELRPAQPGAAARLPSALLRPASVRAFNRMNWLRTPRAARERPMEMGPALFPLDAIGAWNRLYGRRGLIQYQFAVPDGEEWTLRCLLEMLRAQRLPMYLATLKRLGPGSGGMLSFPLQGWTLAIDVPARAPGLADALDRADLLVASAGGRVYLAKDARMASETLAAMYPALPKFLEVRARVDPHETLRSDLSRRLGLTR